MKTIHYSKLSACGWWTFNPEKIKNSSANLWVIAPYNFLNNNIEFIIIEPKELYKRLVEIHGKEKKLINTYLWVFKNNKCLETRGLKKNEIKEIQDKKLEL